MTPVSNDLPEQSVARRLAEETQMLVLDERLAVIGGLQLSAGSHTSFADGVCVLEAVAWVAGESWSDHPACACPVIGAVLRAWNDAITDTTRRTELLAPLVARLVDSRSTSAVELRRSYLAFDWLARVQGPAWAEYERVQGPALAEYKRVTAPAFARSFLS